MLLWGSVRKGERWPVSSGKNTIPPMVALTGFTVAMIAGLSAGNGAMPVLGRGMVAMAACYALGLLVRWVQARMEADHERATAGVIAGELGQSSTIPPRAAESP